MRHILSFIFCVLVGLAAFGCSGGGGSSSSSGAGQSGPSPFVGSYAGTYTNSQGQSGAIALTVSSTGSVTATQVNMTNPSSTALQGSISNNQINFIGGIGSGPLVFNQAGQLTATLSGSGVSTTMTLANTQNGSGLFTPKFAGAFYGVYTGGDTGTMTLIIDGTGDVYGIISNISPNFTSALKGSISSAGALQLNQTNGSGTVTGTVAVGQADLTGSLDDEGNTVSVTLVQQQ